MQPSATSARRMRVATTVAVLLLGVSACTTAPDAQSGGARSSFDPASVKRDPAVAKLVPKAAAAKGSLKVGSDTSYAPDEFIAADGKTIVGMDVDLGKAIGAKMGLQLTFQTADFPSILPSLGTRYDLGISSFQVNSDREKAVDMVSYFSGGTQWAIKKGGTRFDTAPDSTAACGKKVAVQTGTVQLQDDIPARNRRCKAAGKPAISVQSYKLQTDTTTAVAGGKAQAMLAASPVIGYATKTTKGAVMPLGSTYQASNYGIALAKGSPLAKPVLAAVKSMIADGSYARILKTWNASGGAISGPALNPPQHP